MPECGCEDADAEQDLVEPGLRKRDSGSAAAVVDRDDVDGGDGDSDRRDVDDSDNYCNCYYERCCSSLPLLLLACHCCIAATDTAPGCCCCCCSPLRRAPPRHPAQTHCTCTFALAAALHCKRPDCLASSIRFKAALKTDHDAYSLSCISMMMRMMMSTMMMNVMLIMIMHCSGLGKTGRTSSTTLRRDWRSSSRPQPYIKP